MFSFTKEQLIHAADFFVYNFIELAVLFLGVSFLVEIINIFINPEKVQNMLSSNKGGFLIASSLGSLTPFCSCSTIPLTLGLLKAKAAFGPIMTFLFTSPLLNPIIIAVFWSAFGYEVTLVYGFIAFFVSILAGFTLEKLGFEKFIKKEMFEEDAPTTSCCSTTPPQPKEQSSCLSYAGDGSCQVPAKPAFSAASSCCTPTAPVTSAKDDSGCGCSITSPAAKQEESCCSAGEDAGMGCCPSDGKPKKDGLFKKISDQALMKKTWKQFLSFAPYIAIGIGIGAFVHGFVPQEVLAKYASAENPFAVPISAFIGVPLYIRAESMVGLAPALLDKGVSMGSILALTVAGAGASLPEMIMLKKIFKLPIMIFFVVAVFAMAISCGYLVNLYFS